MILFILKFPGHFLVKNLNPLEITWRYFFLIHLCTLCSGSRWSLFSLFKAETLVLKTSSFLMSGHSKNCNSTTAIIASHINVYKTPAYNCPTKFFLIFLISSTWFNFFFFTNFDIFSREILWKIVTRDAVRKIYPNTKCIFYAETTTIWYLIRSETQNIGGKIRKMFYKLFDGMFDVNSL